MRCVYTSPKRGQCPLDAVEELEYCPLHCKDPEAPERAQYNLATYKYRNRYNAHLDSDVLRSLRDEVALARMALEARLNLITNDAEFIAACGQLNTLFLTIEKLVGTCHRLETSLGSLLSKPTLLRIVQQIVDILFEELVSVPDHESIIDRISDKIIMAVSNAAPNEEEKNAKNR